MLDGDWGTIENRAEIQRESKDEILQHDPPPHHPLQTRAIDEVFKS